MSTTETAAAVVVPVRAPSRRFVDFTIEAVVATIAPIVPSSLSKREQIAKTYAAEAKALADTAKKAKTDADAAIKAAADAKAKASGDFGVACGHPGCKVKLLASMAFWNGTAVRCRGHQTVGFGSWANKQRLEKPLSADELRVQLGIVRR